MESINCLFIVILLQIPTIYSTLYTYKQYIYHWKCFIYNLDQHFHSAITSQPHNQSKITRKNKNIPQSQIDLLHIGHVEQSPVMQQASPDDNCEDFYMSSEESPLQDTHENHQEISCSSQTVSSGSIVYTSVSSEDPRIVSNNLQTSRKTRLLTLGSESQLLLSGVPSIPEQLPLILTEGDAEEQESLSLARTEQFQVSCRRLIFDIDWFHIIISIIDLLFLFIYDLLYYWFITYFRYTYSRLFQHKLFWELIMVLVD